MMQSQIHDGAGRPGLRMRPGQAARTINAVVHVINDQTCTTVLLMKLMPPKIMQITVSSFHILSEMLKVGEGWRSRCPTIGAPG